MIAPNGPAVAAPDAAQVDPFGARRWYWQRISAMVLALCVGVHLVVIVWAVRRGLTADAILGRTRGSLAFGAFYTLFVAACAVHAPLGLLAVLEELPRWRGGARSLRITMAAFALLIVVAGLRAVWAVVIG